MNNINEEWRPVTATSGEYEVSSIGRVRSNNTYKHRKRSTILRGHVASNGYVQIASRQWFFLLHRIVAIAFIPNPENKPYVNHKNGIKADNRVENLEWVTALENAQHASKMGLLSTPRRQGVNRYNAKLTVKRVRHIREKKMSGREYAKLYGVSPSLITLVQKNNHWKSCLEPKF